MTAECVVAAAGIEPGQTMLVVGATGGVGSFTVQLAAQAGVRVLATASPADSGYAQGLGAHEVIDFTCTDTTTEALLHQPGGVDVAVDLVNRGPSLATTAAAVKPAGRLVSTLMGPEAFDRGVIPTYVRMAAVDGQLQRLADQVAAGRLSIDVVATYDLADAPKAMAAFAAGEHTRGKVVVTF
jgi:NADPH:quinone reductase-like Zn-dependent oxidoreductase